MSRAPKQLKPAGHSAFVEGLITPLIVIGSSLLSLVAAYVLGEDFLRAILAGQGTAFDYFLLVICAGLGLMVDTATIVSATRFKMHLLRGRQDRLWQTVSAAMLALCLAVETMTLSYFFYLIAPTTIPPGLVTAVQTIHDVLFFIRALMPPLVIVYFVAGVLPVVIERADRDRDLKSRTSQAIGVLTERMLAVADVATPDAAIRLLAAQLELNAYAADDDDDARQRDRDLVAHLAALQGVAWPPAVPDAGEAAPAADSFPAALSIPAAASEPASAAPASRAAAALTQRLPGETRTPSKPAPGTRAYRLWLHTRAADLLRRQPEMTLHALATALSEAPADVVAAIEALRQEAEQRLRPGQRIVDPVLVRLAGVPATGA